jgi:hypothetical protein
MERDIYNLQKSNTTIRKLFQRKLSKRRYAFRITQQSAHEEKILKSCPSVKKA